MTLSRILVAVDFDDDIEALRPAVDHLSRAADVQIIIVGVAPALHESMARKKTASLARNAEQAMLEDLKTTVRRFAGDLDASTEIHIVAGDITTEIIKAALLYEADFVIKLADRPTGERAPHFRAVEKKLIRKCPVPVWIIRQEETRPPETIALAVDNIDALRDKASAELVAAALVKNAVRLAQRFGVSTIHVVHAWSPEGLDFIEHPRAQLSPEDVKRYVSEWEEIARSWLESFVVSANASYSDSGVFFTPKLIMGKAESAIPTAVNDICADILLIGSANRGGVAGLIIGNTAEGVIDRSACSVFVVKPPDFKSVLAQAV